MAEGDHSRYHLCLFCPHEQNLNKCCALSNITHALRQSLLPQKVGSALQLQDVFARHSASLCTKQGLSNPEINRVLFPSSPFYYETDYIEVFGNCQLLLFAICNISFALASEISVTLSPEIMRASSAIRSLFSSSQIFVYVRPSATVFSISKCLSA